MAKNEIVNVLTIKTEESQKTIKGLKKEIADLKKVLENTTIGTEEFDKASKELVAAQLELKTAMSGNKQQTEALAGSYDYLVAEMAKLKKEWRATAYEAKRNEIGKEIDNINTQLKELDETIGNNQRKVGAYAEEFAKALNQNNDNVAASATAFKQALAEQDDATISTRTKLESLQKVTSGLTSGYAAVQGVTALLGIENENLEKTFVKLQAAMAIAQGVGGMKDLVEGLSRGKVAFAGAVNGTKMFIAGLNGVQKAIIGTGIGALVVAIGLLIANWDKITKMFENINPQRKAAKATAELNLEITKLANQSAGDKIARVKELSIAYSKLGDNLNAKKQFVIDYKDELANMGIEMDNVNDADEIFVKNTDAYIKALMARAKADALKQKATEDYKKGLDIIAEAERKAVEAAQNVAGGVLNNGPFAKIKALWGMYDLSTLGEDFTEARRLMEEQFNSLFEQAAKYDAEADKLLTTKKKKNGGGGKSGKTDAEIAAEERAKRQKEIDEELRLSKLNEEEKLIDALDKKYIEYMKVYEGNQEKQLEILEWYTDEYTKIVEKGLDEQIEASNKAAAERERIEKEEYEKKVANSEKRLNASLTATDKASEMQIYTAERAKTGSNSPWGNIDTELSKLETIKSITQETMNLKIAAIEQEMALFEVESERYKELEQQKATIKEETNKRLGELDEQYNKQQKARTDAVASFTMQAFTQALAGASQLISALQANIDTTTEEGFEKNKKMQKANTWINTASGILSAIASAWQLGPIAGAIVGGINSAFTLATGIAQIANINKQQFDSPSSVGGGASASPSVGIAENLPVSYTRNLLTDTEVDEMNAAQQVYILESDIQASNKKVEIREENTNF